MGSKGSNEFRSVLMGYNGFQWNSSKLYGCQWVLMGFNGFQ